MTPAPRPSPRAARASLKAPALLLAALAAACGDGAPGPAPAPVAPVAAPGGADPAPPPAPPPSGADAAWDGSELLVAPGEDHPLPGTGKATFSGEVLGPDGRPVMGATVESYSLPGPGSPHMPLVLHSTATTAADGTFTITGCPEPWEETGILSVKAPGLPRVNLRDRRAHVRPPEFHATPGEPVRVRLREGAEVVGKVLMADLSPPKHPVIVSVGGPYFQEAVRVDPDGGFRMLVPRGALDVSTLPGAYSPVRGAVDTTEGKTVSVDFSLRTAPDVRGRVVDAATGAPIAGAAVRGFYGETRLQKTPADGSFLLPAYWHTAFMVRAPGYAERIHQLAEDAGEKEHVVKLAPGFTASGRVVDGEGKPVPGARLWSLTGDRTGAWVDVRGPYTGADGTFRFVGLPVPAPGREIRIFARKRGWAYSHSGPLDARPRGEATGVVIEMKRLIPLRGTVRDEHGQPAAGVMHLHWNLGPGMEIYAARIPGRQEVKVGDDGSWTATVPERSRLRARLQGDAFLDVHEEFDSIAAKDAPGPLREIRVVRGLAVRGLVVDAAGEPVRGRGEVRVEPSPPTDPRPSRDALIRTDGTFEAGGLPPGLYDFSVLVHPEFLQEVVKGVESGAAPVTVRLRRPGGVTGRVVLPPEAGKSLPFRLTLRGLVDMRPLATNHDREFRDPEGRFSLGPLTPGPYAITLRSGGFRHDGEIAVVEGTPTDLGDIPLALAAWVAGRATCRGEPVRDAVVELLRRLPDGRIESAARCSTGRDGAFVSDALLPGSYTAVIRPQDRPLVERAFELVVGERTTVDLAVPPGAEVEIVSVDPDGKAVPSAVVSLTGEKGGVAFWAKGSAAPPPLATDAAGRLLAAGVPAGKYRVRAGVPGGPAGEADLEAADGASTRVTVTLRPPAAE